MKTSRILVVGLSLGVLFLGFFGATPARASEWIYDRDDGTELALPSPLAAPPGSTAARAAAAETSCGPTGPQRVAVLIVDFPSSDGVPTPTPATVQTMLTGGSLPPIGYFREASRGTASLRFDTFGPYSVRAAPGRPFGCYREANIALQAIAAADRDVDFSRYERVLVIGPDLGCGYGGISSTGCQDDVSTGEGPLRTSFTYLLKSRLNPTVAIHELGHALGLGHAGSRAFSGKPLGAPGKKGRIDAYGDPGSAMGLYNFGYYSAPQRAALGWLAPGTEVATWAPAQGETEFSLHPRGSERAGLYAVRVERGPDAFLWIEYFRAEGDYERTLGQLREGALIYLGDRYAAGRASHLLDFTPGSAGGFRDAALVGRWRDPSTGLQIVARTESSGRLRVKLTPPPAP